MKNRDSITETLMQEYPDDTEAYRNLNADFRSILADWYRRDAFRMGCMWLRLRDLHPECFRSVKSSEQLTQDILEKIPEEQQIGFMEQHPQLLYSIYSLSNGIYGNVVRLLCRMISDNYVDRIEKIFRLLDQNPCFRYTDAFFEELLHYPFSSFTVPIQNLLLKRGGARVRFMVEEAAYRSRRVLRSPQDSMIQQMIRIGMQYPDHSAAQFRAQTEFMKDYVPHVTEEIPWSSGSLTLPAYSGMSHQQLEWYFYWVSELKKDHYIPASPEYMYLYAFALMNHMEIHEPVQVFDRLCWLYQQNPDYHLQEWIHDYGVYYEIPVYKLHSFLTSAGKDTTFRLTEAAAMLQQPEKESALEIALQSAHMTVDSWRKKAYYENMSGFFCYAIVRIRDIYEKRTGKCFTDLWTGKPYPKVWEPMKDVPVALPPAAEGETRRVNAYESYRVLNQRWVGWHYYGADYKWIHTMLLLMEDVFRRQNGMSGKNYTIKDAEPWLRAELENAAREYQKEIHKPKVNLSSLEAIRNKADRLQERLITEEEEETVMEEIHDSTDDDTLFTPDEIKVLQLLLKKENMMSWARTRGLMPQVVYESINEKALEWIGDILIEDGEIYEEYRETVEEYLRIQ